MLVLVNISDIIKILQKHAKFIYAIHLDDTQRSGDPINYKRENGVDLSPQSKLRDDVIDNSYCKIINNIILT